MLSVIEKKHVGTTIGAHKECCKTCVAAMNARILTIGFGEIGNQVIESLSHSKIHNPGLYAISDVSNSIEFKRHLDDSLINEIAKEYSAVLISGEWTQYSDSHLWIKKLCHEIRSRQLFSAAFITDDPLVKSQQKNRCIEAGIDAFFVAPQASPLNTLETYTTIYKLLLDAQMVCVDYEDIRTVLSAAGETFTCKGFGIGQYGARDAANDALSRMRADGIDLNGATGIVIAIGGPDDMSFASVNDACVAVQAMAHENANIIFGAIKGECENNYWVRIIAAGYPNA